MPGIGLALNAVLMGPRTNGGASEDAITAVARSSASSGRVRGVIATPFSEPEACKAKAVPSRVSKATSKVGSPKFAIIPQYGPIRGIYSTSRTFRNAAAICPFS